MNWKQELQREMTGIDGLNQNTATLEYRIDSGDDFFGGSSRIIVISRSLIVKAPVPVRERLIDGMRYRAGDFTCQVSWARLQEAHTGLASDPVIIIDGTNKSMDDVRPFTAAGNWGIALGVDTLALGGDKWNIVGVTARQWLDNEPALLDLTLRR